MVQFLLLADNAQEVPSPSMVWIRSEDFAV